MENIIFGIITIGVSGLAYFFSWKQYQRNNFNVAILLIILGGFLLYFYTATDFFLHVWDERYHALVAKNLIKHPFLPTLYDNPILPFDYKMWVGNHIWLHKQPLPLWLMAGSMSVFGVNEIALRLPSIILSSTGIFLTFKIGEYFFNKKTGILASFLFSINGLILELTGGRVATDHIDISFMFFILLAIFLTTVFIKKKSILYTLLIGGSIGAAILTKWLTGLIVLPIWLLMVWDSNSFNMKILLGHFILLLLTITLVALPWQLYIFRVFPMEAAYESSFNMRHFTEVIEERSGSFFYFINQIRINYGELIYLPLIWFVLKLFKNPKEFKQFAVLIWFMVPLIIFSFAKTKMQGYLLFTSSALFIITSAFFFELLNYKVPKNLRWVSKLVLFLMILLPIRYSIERLKPFEKRERNPTWVLDLKELNKKHIQNGVLFNYSNPIEAMFYTELVTYSTLPSKDIVEQLLNEGYQIIINDNDDIEHLKKIKGVKTIRLTTSKN